jgi:hypothetical protein
MKNKLFGIYLVIAAVFVICIYTYVDATGEQITVCVKKNGALHIVNSSTECAKGVNILSWNIQGPKGDKGDVGLKGEKGEQGPVGLIGTRGESAVHGAGQFAFVHSEYGAGIFVLKTDGTVWRWAGGLVQVVNTTSIPTYVPVPVKDIVSWNLYVLVDKDGNGWNYEPTAPFWTVVPFP